MNQKNLTVVASICFFVAAVLFFTVGKNIALGICFTALGVGGLVRVMRENKAKNDIGK